nr:hypothetical protein [uncultured Acetatifactor sp.]
MDKNCWLLQIKDRQYASWIQDYMGEILPIGINFDRKSKEHTCVIEAWGKMT